MSMASMLKDSYVPADFNAYLQKSKGFDQVINKAKVTAIGNGHCAAEIKLEECHLNAMGGLHGGLSAALIDCISTYGLISVGNVPGVSVDLHASFLKGAKGGDVITIESKVVKKGLTLAFLEAVIKDKSGDTLVKASHTKYIGQ